MRDKDKEDKYIKERAVKRKSIRNAAKSAGISLATAARAEADPRIRSEMAIAIDEAAKRRGYKSAKDKIADTVIESLEATKVISANVIAPDGEGMKDANSMTKDFVEVPDFQARIKAADLAGKFRGDFIERHEIGSPGEFDNIADRLEQSKKKSAEAVIARRARAKA